jgi:small-conductance mechanosensitive channel
MNRSRIISSVIIVLGLIGIFLFGFIMHNNFALGLGAVIAAFIAAFGLGILLYRGFQLLSFKIQAILLGAVYLVLVVLLFVQPEIPIFIGFCLLLLPLILALVKLSHIGTTLESPDAPRDPRPDTYKVADMDVSTGCILTAASFIGGIVLLLLGWLFQRGAFTGFLGVF